MYKTEIERIFKSNNHALELTKYVNDDVFMDEFVEFTKPALLEVKYNSFIDSDTEKKIFMAFTFVALKHYDGRLWDHFYKYYVCDNLSRREIYYKIRINVFSQWVKGYHCDTNKREQTYQIPVIESVIPFFYATKYIDFVFDIYEKCFEYSLENVDEELDLFFNATRELLQTDDGTTDTFENKNTDGSSKTYVLIQGIKRIIKYSNFKNKERQLKEFTKQFLLRIDNYYSQQNKIETNYYFDKSFEEWVKDNPEIRIKKSSGEREIYLNNRKPRFIFNTNNGKVYLRSPMLHIAKKDDISKIKLYVYENGNEIHCGPLHIKDMMSLMEVCYKEIEIENPLNLIRCKIVYEGEKEEVLYDSNEKLYRKNIFFDGEKEIKYDSSFNGKLFVLCRPGFKNDLNFVRSLSKYSIYSLEVSEENYSFIIDSNHYSFKGSFESELFGDLCKPMIFTTNEAIKAFRKISSLVLLSKNKSVKGNYIKINNNILLDDLYISKEQKNNIAYILDTNAIFTKNGFYDVKLIDKSNNHIVDEFIFVLDSDLKIEEGYISEDRVLANITSSYLISNEQELIQCSENVISEEENNKFNISYENVINEFESNKFNILIDGCKMEFKLKLTVPYYSLEDGYKMMFGQEISKKNIDLNSVLYFYNLKDKVTLRFDDSTRSLLTKSHNKQRYIELSELKNHEETKKIELVFIDYKGEEQILTLYNKPIYDFETSNIFFDLINQSMTLSTFIYGFETVNTIETKIMVDDEEFYKYKLINNGEVKKIELDGSKHTINVYVGYWITDIDYDTFEEIRTFTVIFEAKFEYTPLDSLINNALYVKYLLCDSEDAVPENLRPPLFIKLLSKINQNSYLCEAYHDKYLSFKSKLGKLFIEFEPMYIAETNNKRRMNAIINSYINETQNVLYFDSSKVELNESKWSEKVDYFVIEEDGTW